MVNIQKTYIIFLYLSNKIYTKWMKMYRKLLIVLFMYSLVFGEVPILNAGDLEKNSKTSFLDNILYYLYKPVTYLLPHMEMRKPIYETETQYYNIRVEQDEQGLMHLVFLPRKGSQSIYDPAKPDRLVSSFMKYAFLSLPALGHKPEKVLFIGLGGGIMPMFIRKNFPDTEIDIVEIDDAIPQIAEDYFGFVKDSKMSVNIGDGRVYVNKTKLEYDIIFLDVYNAESIPFQFTTVEFFKKLKTNLASDGVLAINLANLANEKFIPAELNTLFSVFKNGYIFVCPGETNYVPILLADETIDFGDFENAVLKYDSKNIFNFKFEELMKNHLDDDNLNLLMKRNESVYTDDFAPVNLLH